MPVPGQLALEDTLPLRMTRDANGNIYVAFTKRSTADADDIILYKTNFYGVIDSAFGNNFQIGYANFTVPRPFALTSLVVNTNGTISMGGYHASGDGNENISFRTYNPATQFLTTTIFDAPAGEVAVGTGCKTPAAVLANQVLVFPVAFPFAPNQYRIFIQSHRPGTSTTSLNASPWQYPGAVSAEPTSIIKLNAGGYIVTGKMTRQNGTTAGVVIKFNADGTIDNSFGEQGAYIVNGRQGSSPWEDVAQLPDNKYLAVGSAAFVPTAPEKKAIIINRFNADGSIDESFGTNGTVYEYTSDYGRSASQVFSLENGKFLLGGTYTNFSSEPGVGTGSPGTRATVYRMMPDGRPDSSFGLYQNGRYMFSGAVGLSFSEMQVLNDTIYMGGNTATSHTGNYKAMVVKLTPDGSVSDTYYPSVTLIHTFTVSQLTGNSYIGGGTNGSAKVICKLKPSIGNLGGKPDTSFGNNGVAVIPVVAAGEVTIIRQIKLRPGAILVASEWAASNSSTAVKGLYFTLISQQGVVDATFGTNGNKFLQLPGATSIIAEQFKWTGQDNNRLLIFGEAIVNGATKGFVCKVDLNGDLDATFGTAGVIWTTATFEDRISFDRKGNMIGIKKTGLLTGGALTKLDIPADVYNRIKQGGWTGGISNDWFNPGNWAEGVVPDAYTEVVIANGNAVIGPGTHAFAYSVRLLGGATLTVSANSTLDITSNH